MKAFTDYPLAELGDVSNEKAPIREGIILDYDGDKCCAVLIERQVFFIKTGYLYTEAGRCGDVPTIDVAKLLD